MPGHATMPTKHKTRMSVIIEPPSQCRAMAAYPAFSLVEHFSANAGSSHPKTNPMRLASSVAQIA